MSGAMFAHPRRYAPALGFHLGLILAALPLWAQTSGFRVQTPASRPLVTIRGTVQNSLTGEPIRRALVMLQGQGQRSVLTDDEGRFAIESVSAVFGSLTAQLPGYFNPKERGVKVDPEKSTDYELKLTPAPIIYGRVVGANDEPLERAPVRLVQSQIVDGRRRWIDFRSVITDEDGQFRIADLRPGMYKISAGPVRNLDLAALTSGYGASYFPDSPDRNSAPPMNLTAGQQLEANFKLRAVSVYSVSGTVVGFSGVGANIEFLDASNNPVPMPHRFNPGDGSFLFPAVPAGHYIVRATSYTENGPQQRARASINVNAALSGLLLALQPAITIPVVFRSEFTKPEQRDIPRQSLSGEVRLSSTIDFNSFFAQPENGADDRRNLTIRNVEPGTYDVEIRPHGPWYVASAQYGSRNVLGQPLVISSGTRGEPIEIVLRDDVGMIEGTLRNGTEAVILAVSDSRSSLPILGYAGGGDGHDYIPQLAPGSYYVYAFDNVNNVEYGNPDVLRDYRSHAARVTVSPNQTVKVTLDIIATEP
jgi:hypothetical protein